MNENLEKAVAKSLELAEKTGELVIEQAPEIIQEFYNWHLASSIIWIVISLIVIIIYCWNFKKWYNGAFIGFDENEELYTVLILLVGLASVFSIVGILENTIDLIKILTAPKLYLIEYFLR
jgi:hypothetical protein